jgi:hypothetical protein
MTARLTACLLTGLLFEFQWKGAPPPELTVAVRNVTTTLASIQSEGLVLPVRFDAVVRYQTKVDLHIGTNPVVVTLIERLRGPQDWEARGNFHFDDIGQVKYGACSSGPPREGETLVLPNIDADVLVRRTDENAHSHVVVRFHLRAACKEGDKIFTQPLVTEPVDLKLPKW